MLGIQADPNFATNHYVYIYYSPADTSVNRLSRFTYVNNRIDLKSEKVILQLYSQREICCHTGGSIAFDGKGLLYVSTGDNSTPFDEPKTPYPSHGYAPLDDRPGHLQYDSRRGAGNTNDLRGKILRIKVKSDGTYEIPEGNLFPAGEEKTRPEIYVMGDRNPYRISVDKKNGFLYWGEVGPDANNDSLSSRGPRGYDEVNQCKKSRLLRMAIFRREQLSLSYPRLCNRFQRNRLRPGAPRQRIPQQHRPPRPAAGSTRLHLVSICSLPRIPRSRQRRPLRHGRPGLLLGSLSKDHAPPGLL
ncbi:PQQ-dependent sugar dehydrogenase [Puia sp. P3]|uniref:PQQ-dependent sugar dehydrogenase n=1 Tax=Puia sp. P3 TaxID=3423952 RepID=UPI003D674801